LLEEFCDNIVLLVCNSIAETNEFAQVVEYVPVGVGILILIFDGAV
jgi:hypothetical protein